MIDTILYACNRLKIVYKVQLLVACLKLPPEASLDILLDVLVAYDRLDSDFIRKLNNGLQVQNKATGLAQKSLASVGIFSRKPSKRL